MKETHFNDFSEHHASVTAFADPAPGSTLEHYVACLQSIGAIAFLSENKTYAWVRFIRSELSRFPLECRNDPDPSFLRKALNSKGIWFASYLVSPTDKLRANCFDYVCSAVSYHIETLHKYARRDIRRGLRNFVIRICTWDELADHGFSAEADTAARHGYSSPPEDSIKRFVDRNRHLPFYEIWGAWKDSEMCAWMLVMKIDNHAHISVCRSRTAYLTLCPNNALLYTATRRLLAIEKRSYVSYGLSSIQVDVDELSMHKYKTRMGYEAIPARRIFVVHPLLRPMLHSRILSWTWEKLANRLPSSASLKKVAGLSRLLSGRENNPLSWTDRNTEHNGIPAG